jgi:DNA-binding transcriptional regulator YhcF (GntR family)
MITLTFKEVNNPVFLQVLGRLDNSNIKEVEFKKLYAIQRLASKFQMELKKLRKGYKLLLEKYAVQDEKTKVFKANPDGSPVLKDESQKNAFDNDLKEFLNTKFDVKIEKFTSEDLYKLGFSPKELRVCAKIVSDMDEEVCLDDESEDA